MNLCYHNNVNTQGKDRILIVENDPVVSDLIARQALQAAGYQTAVVSDASSAINRAVQLMPDVVIANLNLPGLSGKDLLVALSSQNMETPVIVLAKKGQEASIIQAFRLGAIDYILWPVREPEVINVVERVLKQVHERQERERLSRQLQQTNQELQLRVRELTTIFSVGKAVTSITNQSVLMEKILEGAARVTQADLGWFLLRQENDKTFRLAAQRGLPDSLTERLNQPWDDGISSLVAMSGEPLTIHGDPLKRFKISNLGQSAMIVPIRVQNQVTALLVVMRKQAIPFGASEQHLLEAVADYASISMVNARLFQVVEDRARSLESQAARAQSGEKVNLEILKQVRDEQQPAIESALEALNTLAKDPAARWTANQRPALSTLQDQLQLLAHITQSIHAAPPPAATSGGANLSELVRQCASRAAHTAQQNGLTFNAEISSDEIKVRADAAPIAQVVEGLLSNAFKYATPSGRVTLRLEKNENLAHLAVSDTGAGIEPTRLSKVFESGSRAAGGKARRFGGLGISLNLAREIINLYQGKIWVESQPGLGSHFHFTLPLFK